MRIKHVLSVVVALLFAGVSFAATMSLADARAKIGNCIASESTMTSVIKQLSPADQVTFLTDVNTAIGGRPGSAESKAATYLVANRAAVRAADSGNKTAMIAEVFATVPLEVLTLINESFAKELLNRDNGASKNITDENYQKVAMNIMAKVNERCASVENAGVRAAFALLMLVRADNGKIANLTDTLIATLPKESQNVARTEWIPAALGQGQEKTYDPMLGGLENTVQLVENDVVIRLVGPQLLESMLCEIVEGTPLINNSEHPDVHGDGVLDVNPAPRPAADPTEVPDYEGPEEPKPYDGQIIRA